MGQDTRTLGSSRCCHKRTNMKEGCLVAFDRADLLHFTSSRCTHFAADLPKILRMPAVVAILCIFCTAPALRIVTSMPLASAHCSGGKAAQLSGKAAPCLTALLDTATRHTFLVSCDPLYYTPFIVGYHSPTDEIDLERVICSLGWPNGHRTLHSI